MRSKPFRFAPIRPRIFLGRYSRPLGDESAYHVTVDGEIRVVWKDNGYTYDCFVRETQDVKSLAAAVNAVKKSKAGSPGGSFIINEFGQVICPVANSYNRYLVGEVNGPLYFEDLKGEDGFLCLDCNDLDCGDDWDRPYIGVKYHLHAGDHIYFWSETTEGGTKILPPEQDTDLIDSLREIRPNGGMTFAVNQHGIAIAKQEIGRSRWKPVYVGQIDYDMWFEREE